MFLQIGLVRMQLLLIQYQSEGRQKMSTLTCNNNPQRKIKRNVCISNTIKPFKELRQMQVHKKETSANLNWIHISTASKTIIHL